MIRFSSLLMLSIVTFAAVLGTRGMHAKDAGPDKYEVRVPDGLSFAEFHGYEGWQVLSVTQTDKLLKVALGNPVMVEAYRSGIPDNGQPFPDGSKSAKVMWKRLKGRHGPISVDGAGDLAHVGFMVKDSERFGGIGGWGYAQFDYDPISDRFSPDGTGVSCGTACHTLVKDKDYVFTPYTRR